jgi:hypothetical protein
MQCANTHPLCRSKRLSSRNLLSSLLIQPAQIGLPANRNAPREDVPELRRHIHKAERSNSRPELDAVLDANGKSLLQPLPRFVERRTSKKRVHTKEVRVEYGSKARLLHNNLGQNRQELARIVEMVSEEHEPKSGLYQLTCTYANRYPRHGNNR